MSRRIPDPPPAQPSCDGMSQEEMIRDLWKAHYHQEKGVMIRLDRVERRMRVAVWVVVTLVGAAVYSAVDAIKTKVFG